MFFSFGLSVWFLLYFSIFNIPFSLFYYFCFLFFICFSSCYLLFLLHIFLITQNCYCYVLKPLIECFMEIMYWNYNGLKCFSCYLKAIIKFYTFWIKTLNWWLFGMRKERKEKFCLKWIPLHLTFCFLSRWTELIFRYGTNVQIVFRAVVCNCT